MLLISAGDSRVSLHREERSNGDEEGWIGMASVSGHRRGTAACRFTGRNGVTERRRVGSGWRRRPGTAGDSRVSLHREERSNGEKEGWIGMASASGHRRGTAACRSTGRNGVTEMKEGWIGMASASGHRRGTAACRFTGRNGVTERRRVGSGWRRRPGIGGRQPPVAPQGGTETGSNVETGETETGRGGRDADRSGVATPAFKPVPLGC